MFKLLIIATLLCGSAIGQGSNQAGVVVTASSREPKIVNGVTARIETIPYQISLHRLNYYNSYDYVCGGSIISQFWVLTAGHCVEADQRPDSYVIIAGATIIGYSSTTSNHFLSSIYMHGGFQNSPTDGVANDVALMEVRDPFIFDTYRQPISLPPKNYVIPIGTAAYVSGWGSTNPTVRQSTAVLQIAVVPVISKDICAREWYNFDKNGKLCVGTYGNGIGTCAGDSGGPLVANNYLIGITSWGSDPCSALPSVFTDVAYYRDWINQVSGV